MERWRPKTNSFHLTCGEITIILGDVHFILGLPVVGKPLTCPLFDTPLAHFKECFGNEVVAEYKESKKRGSISLLWL